jgi:hypothetical protein
LNVPPEVLAFLYSELPPEVEEAIEAQTPGIGSNVRNLKLYGFDAYITTTVAAAVGATRYAPNTKLMEPFQTAELDGVVLHDKINRLIVLETTISTDEESTTRPAQPSAVNDLKTKYMQWAGLGNIEGVSRRYVYASAGTFAFPQDPEWGGLFEAIAKMNPDTLQIVELGRKFPVLDEVSAGIFDPAHLRAAFDYYVQQIVTAATT